VVTVTLPLILEELSVPEILDHPSEVRTMVTVLEEALNLRTYHFQRHYLLLFNSRKAPKRDVVPIPTGLASLQVLTQ